MFRVLPLLFLLPISAAAFEIPKENRVPNQKPGYCAWACLETIGKTHKIKGLYGLVEDRKDDDDLEIETTLGKVLIAKNVGYMPEIKKKLTGLGVGFKSQISKDRDILKYSSVNGVTVSFRPNPTYKGPHAVLLVEYGEKQVKFYDPNQPETLWVASREWFDRWWTGYAIVVWDKTWETEP